MTDYFCTLLKNNKLNADAANYSEYSSSVFTVKFIPFIEKEIGESIESLTRNKSPGPDHEQTSKVLKDGASPSKRFYFF